MKSWLTAILWIREQDRRTGRIWVGHALRIWALVAVVVCAKSVLQATDQDATFPMLIAEAIWTLTPVGLLVWSLRRMARDLFPDIWSYRREAIWLTLTLLGAMPGLWSDRSGTLMLAIVILGVAALAGRHWNSGSLLLTVAITIRNWPITLVMLLAARSPRRLVGRTAVCMAAIAATIFFLRPMLGQLGLPNLLNLPGLHDVSTAWRPPRELVRYDWITLLRISTGAAAFFWTFYQFHRSKSERHYLTVTLAIWTAWQLLFGPTVGRSSCILVAPMMSWALVSAFKSGHGRTLALTAWSIGTLLSYGTFQRMLEPYFPGTNAILPLSVVLYVVWLIRYADHATAGRVVLGVRTESGVQAPFFRSRRSRQAKSRSAKNHKDEPQVEKNR